MQHAQDSPQIIVCKGLNEALDRYISEGYRLEMIFPADEPSVAIVSRNGLTVRLEGPESASESGCPDIPAVPVISRVADAKWITGRADMEYRDLVPARLGGKLIASHIKIANAGEVSDYVHYHKVAFQIIYCWQGRVRVVYEDCGEPFWLHPGDCVLQPPEIRHRVLEASANTQVIELTSPAIHETWVDHDLKLPTSRILPDRSFAGQRFIHHQATDSNIVYDEFGGFESRHMGIAAASNNAARVCELRTLNDSSTFRCGPEDELNTFYFVLSGHVSVFNESVGQQKFMSGDAILIPPQVSYEISASANSAVLCVAI